MFFKLNSRNPYRDLLRNVRRIATAELNNDEKLAAYKELYGLLQYKLKENERFLNTQTAYNKRCVHWNQRNIYSIKPVNNLKNPWLAFKRSFKTNLQYNTDIAIKKIEIDVAWFFNSNNDEDWLVA